MDFVIILAILAVVVLVVSAPLRRTRDAAPRERSGLGLSSADAVELAELEAAREAKYREIRDAELDLRTGKLSEADYQAVDHELRAEAMEILRSLDRVGGGDEASDRETGGETGRAIGRGGAEQVVGAGDDDTPTPSH